MKARMLWMVTVAVGLSPLAALCVRVFAVEEGRAPLAPRFDTARAASENRKLGKAVLDAARTAYETTYVDYKVGTATFSELCDWSRRWAHAELGIAADHTAVINALRRHSERLRKLHKDIQALNAVGAKGGERQKLDSAAFFLAEADMWLAVAEAPRRQ